MTAREAHLTEFLSALAPGRGAPPEGGRLDLDSLALLQVVTYLEQTYGIRLAEWDVEPDDLRSVTGILALIERCA
jgi:acyl carrier protein